MMKQRCKTLPARVLAVVLSLVMPLGSLPVSAAESRFLSFQVESVSENGSKTESREAAYVVGQELMFLPISWPSTRCFIITAIPTLLCAEGKRQTVSSVG